MIVNDEMKTRLSESVPDPLLGRTIDGYRIEEIIGRGGMGIVYRAMQLSLARPVAIKVLPEEVTENKQFLDRFEREVDILARMSHPNIVTVFERGNVDGRSYIVMEFVRGSSLREVMRNGPVPPAEALVLVRSILAALEHAHGEGIVHRDIKPENVLVAPGGIVKVADFGLSRLLENDMHTRLTKTHVALGTFEYMSPEQREMSRDADARSDIYATGVVLYEMIAGELPIGAFDALSVKRPQECDRRLDGIVERSLKKSPDSRWQNAREMGDAVSHLLSSAQLPIEPVLAPAPRPSEIPEQSMLVSDVRPPLPPAKRKGEEQDEGMTGEALLWSLFGIGVAAAFFMFMFTGAVVPIVFFGLGVATVAVLIAYGMHRHKNRHLRPPAHPHADGWQQKYGLSLAVTAIWVAIVLVLSSPNWRGEEIIWLCIGAIASVFLLPKIPALFAGAARAVVGILVALIVLAVVIALFWGVRVEEMEGASDDAIQRAAFAEAMASPPRPVAPDPLLLDCGAIKGNVDTVEMARFLKDSAVQSWVKSVVPNADLSLGDGYSFSTQGSKFRVGLRSFRNLSGIDRTRVAAALGMAAQAMFPRRVVTRSKADEAFEATLAANSFVLKSR